MREVSAADFTRNFGKYSDIVQREPVVVTSNGMPTGYFISAVAFAEMRRLKCSRGAVAPSSNWRRPRSRR